MSEDQDQDEGSRRGPMIALIVVVVLVIGGIYLTHVLSGVSKIQDCAMSGRSNCAPVGK
jgi:hypothetical protein